MKGSASAGPNDQEGFASTAINASQGVFQVTGGANLTSMDLANITRGTTATAEFDVSGSGQITTTSTNDSTGILGPWAIYLNNDWAMVNGSNQIVAFTGYALKDDPGTWSSADHVSYGGTTAHVAADSTVTSLRLDPETMPFYGPVLNIDSGQTLTVANGGVLTTSRAGLGTINGPGTITSGTSTLFFHTDGGVQVNAVVANGTAGATTVIHSGPGYYEPTATNTYTGDTVINSGSILLDMDNTVATLTDKGVAGALGAGNNIVLNGGTLAVQTAVKGPQSTNRDIQIGGVTGIDVNGQVTFSGLISDPSIKGALEPRWRRDRDPHQHRQQLSRRDADQQRIPHPHDRRRAG